MSSSAVPQSRIPPDLASSRGVPHGRQVDSTPPEDAVNTHFDADAVEAPDFGRGVFVKGRSFSCAVASLWFLSSRGGLQADEGSVLDFFSSLFSPSGVRLFRARVIVNNPPSLRKFAEDQREHSRRLLVIRHHQMEPAAHERRIRAERLYLQIAERQRSHRIPIRLIPLPIPIQRRLPSFRLRRAGKESKLRRIPVSGHELFQVVTVPRVYLSLQYRTNRRVNTGRVLILCRCNHTRNQKNNHHQPCAQVSLLQSGAPGSPPSFGR